MAGPWFDLEKESLYHKGHQASQEPETQAVFMHRAPSAGIVHHCSP